jgi:hypothetical protein
VTDARRYAPHVARNTGPILEALRETLPEKGLVLEVASGSGEQSAAFARAFPKLLWQPSDPDPAALASIDAWRQSEALFNLLPAIELDARATGWRIASAEAIVCINMVHISPWSACLGLIHGAGRLLEPGMPLYLYGPYRQASVETAPSNEAFDQSLKSRNPEWGLRNLEDVAGEAERHGLALERAVPMPSNNLSLIFRRR